jgi:hypothetical protein
MFSEHAPSDQYPIDYDLGFFVYLLQQHMLKTANHPATFVFTHRTLTVCYNYRLVYLYKHFPWLALLTL